MTGVYEIRPAQWWDWPFHGVVAEQASIPAVTTLPASDDQQAVTVRFSYPVTEWEKSLGAEFRAQYTWVGGVPQREAM